MQTKPRLRHTFRARLWEISFKNFAEISQALVQHNSKILRKFCVHLHIITQTGSYTRGLLKLSSQTYSNMHIYMFALPKLLLRPTLGDAHYS